MIENKMRCSFCGKDIEKSVLMEFCPHCNKLLLIDTGKNPWNPVVAVINSLIFTPMAGALVTAVNLVKFGEKRKAGAVLISTVLSSIALIIAMPCLPIDKLWVLNLLFYTVLPMFFWLIQKDDFRKWKIGNPHEAAGQWKKTLILSFAGLLIGVFISLFFMSLLNIHSTRKNLGEFLSLIGFFLFIIVEGCFSNKNGKSNI